VLFTADTDFRFDGTLSNPYVNSYHGQINVSASSLALVDAPHHGSIKNDFAYSVINSWLPVRAYVRLEGARIAGYGAFLTFQPRLCVETHRRCSGKHTAPQTHVITVASSTRSGSSHAWAWPPATPVCPQPC
jgi:hypothetical protein